MVRKASSRQSGMDNSDYENRNISFDGERKYRLLFEKSPIGIFQFDNNAVITDCNDRFVDILQSTKEKLIGLDIHTLNDQSVMQAFDDAIAGKQGYYEGVYHATTSSAIIYVTLKTVPLFSADNSYIEGGLGIVEDSTERVRAEKALKKQEHYFRVISSLTTDAASVLTINSDGSFNREWISDTLLTTFGYAQEDIDSFEKWAKIVHPDDIDTYKQAIEHILKGEKVSLDFRIVTKFGRIYWLNNTVYPEYDESGKPIRLISAIKDITSQKEAELEIKYQKNLLDTIINIAPIGIWLSGLDGSYPIINKEFSELIGYGTENLSITPEELENCQASDKLAMESNDPIETEETITYSDGQKHTIRVFKRKLLSPEDKVIGVLGVSTDITDRIRYEKALVEALEKAEESDKLKSAFLANMSHEIRTPLNGIIGFAKFLRNFPETTRDESLKFLNIICNSADHLLTLINDIIDISKIDVGQLKINPEPVNLNGLLNEIYSFYYGANPDLSKRGLSFRITTTMSDSESNIVTDSVRLRQILTNLVGNALKFTDKGVVEFGYELIKDKSAIKFYVSDTGIGIPADKIEQIFQRFRQADLDITRKYGGTGLGLAISKSLVELMGGKIWAESKVDVGATFYFTLPLVKTSNQDIHPIYAVNNDELTMKCKGKRVLIAEDDPNSLFYLKTVLQNLGMICIEAQNGREAVDRYKENRDVNLIMMDLKMPVLSGFDAIKEIRSVSSKVPILVQTAHVFSDERVLCSTLGCDYFITKPVDLNALYANLLQILK